MTANAEETMQPSRSTTEQLYGLSEPVQEMLLRIAHLAAGMSSGEKAMTRMLLGAGALQLVEDSEDDDDDSLAAAEIMTATGRVVQYADEQAGALASWMVV